MAIRVNKRITSHSSRTNNSWLFAPSSLILANYHLPLNGALYFFKGSVMATLMVNNVSQGQSVSEVTLTASELIEKVKFLDDVSIQVKSEFKDWVQGQFSDLSSNIDNLPELLNQMQSDLINSAPVEQIELIIKSILG